MRSADGSLLKTGKLSLERQTGHLLAGDRECKQNLFQRLLISAPADLPAYPFRAYSAAALARGCDLPPSECLKSGNSFLRPVPESPENVKTTE